MVVKKRTGSFDKDGEYMLPFANDGGAEVKMGKTRSPLHEDLADGSPRFWGRLCIKRSESPVLPTFTTHFNPQAADASIPTSSKVIFRTGTRKTAASSFVLFGLVICGLIAFSFSKSSLNDITEQLSVFNDNRNTLLLKVRGAEKDVRMLEREASALESMRHRRLSDVDPNESSDEQSVSFKELMGIKSQIAAKTEHASGLQERVKVLSRHEALQKYGSGPHRVEVELDLPGEAASSSFIVELASLDLLPHSVDTFLGMVAAGLWDEWSLVTNSLHVVETAPLSSDGNDGKRKLEAFEKESLNHLAFNEYSEQFPHEKFSLGFSGGESPSWYINTEDNTDIHRGDPCFGKIVEGFDTIRKLGAQSAKDGHIGIKRVKIV